MTVGELLRLIPAATIQRAGSDADLAIPVTGLLEDATVFPLAAPQLTFGTVLGTMGAIRYYPGQTIKKIGKVNYFGFSILHNPSVWLRPVAVHAVLA